MPIIATIISGLLFWGCYWFFFLDGHKKIGAILAGKRDAKRRAAAIEAQIRAPIKSIKDPREAGTVLLFLIARLKGDYSAAQLAAIEQEMRGVMAIEGDLAPFISYAGYACTTSPSVTAAIQDIAPLFNDRLTEQERDHLFAMVERIAEVDGPPNEDQQAALNALRIRLATPELAGEGFGFTKARD